MYATILIFCLIPNDFVATDHFDIVEINHVNGPHGHYLSQILFINYSVQANTYVVDKWIMLEKFPSLDRDGDLWVLWFSEGRGIRRITTRNLRTSISGFDVEVRNRLVCPIDDRLGWQIHGCDVRDIVRRK